MYNIYNVYVFFFLHNKFLLLLRKGVYPYEYMHDCEKLIETLLHETEDFYRHCIK